jgi:hypothetical protein
MAVRRRGASVGGVPSHVLAEKRRMGFFGRNDGDFTDEAVARRGSWLLDGGITRVRDGK